MRIGIAGLPNMAQNYIHAIQNAGGPAVPVWAEVSLLPETASCWDALLLPGGGDIDPLLLPGRPTPHPKCFGIDPDLDRLQLALLDIFVRQKKPVLGICKGMQLINLYFGGSLCQHLPTAETHRYKEYDQFHPTHAKNGSFLAGLYGLDFTVNSAHHQGIVPPPPDSGKASVSVIQTAPDGVPEGIVHCSLPVIGLQWHPERLCGRPAPCGAVDGSLVFRYFLSLVQTH